MFTCYLLAIVVMPLGGGGGIWLYSSSVWDHISHVLFPIPPPPPPSTVQIIQQQPPRQESLNNIADHEKRLEMLVASENSLQDKLELRKKQFHLLVQCVHQLQDMLHGEGRGEEEKDREGMEGNEVEAVVMDTS